MVYSIQNTKIGTSKHFADSIFITDDKKQIENRQMLFVIGANDGVLVRESNGIGLFTYNELVRLEQQGVQFTPSVMEINYNEKFAISNPPFCTFLSFKTLSQKNLNGQSKYLSTAEMLAKVLSSDLLQPKVFCSIFKKVKYVLWKLVQVAKRSDFETASTELTFGFDWSKLPPYELKLVQSHCQNAE